MIRPILSTLFLLVWSVSSSQELRTPFTHTEFYNLVLTEHPLSKRAELNVERGERELQSARGNFDPSLYSDWDQKRFEGSDYFSHWNSYVEIPVLFNVNWKVGLEQNSGEYLNPEFTVPSDGLWYAGVELPLLQGLLTDTRRTELNQAKASVDLRDAEMVLQMNDLLLDAAAHYWAWYESYFKANLADTAYKLTLVRFQGIRTQVKEGFEADIDSLEAYINLQVREVNLNKANLNLQKAEFDLNNFLWGNTADGPMVLEQRYPDTVDIFEKYNLNQESMLIQAESAHPKLLSLTYKQSQAAFEKRLKNEYLKPKLNASYNFLAARFSNPDPGTFLENDYKMGISFGWNLPLRSERAQVQLADIKIKELSYERDATRAQVRNKVKSVIAKYNTQWNLLEQQQQIVNHYTRLLEAEYIKFFNGESSVFLVNSRETSLIAAVEKLIEMEAELGVLKAEIGWAMGDLLQRVQGGQI